MPLTTSNVDKVYSNTIVQFMFGGLWFYAIPSTTKTSFTDDFSFVPVGFLCFGTTILDFD